MAQFVTAAQLRERLKGLLKVSHLEDIWDLIVEQAAENAYQDILARLVRRGFSVAQIGTWSRRVEFSYHIGLYWCLIEGGALHSYDDKFIEKLNRRKELERVKLLTDSGTEISPASTGARVGRGKLSVGDDTFTLDTEW